MEFPITRARLQNIHSERQQLIKTKYIDYVLEGITKKIIESADRGTHGLMKPTTLQIMLNDSTTLFTRSHNDMPSCGRHVFIPEILRKVQERFPDTTISLDPMNTYIYIDWS
jgi:very-short-patch-repair endonuclease